MPDGREKRFDFEAFLPLFHDFRAGKEFFIYLVFRLQKEGKLRAATRRFWKTEADIFPKTNDECALPFLGQAKIEGIQHRVVGEIAEFLEVLENGFEGASLVVRTELFDVFEQKSERLFDPQNLFNIEKQGAARIRKPLFRPDNAERLARKPGQQNVVVGNVVRVNLGDVARWFFAKMSLVHRLRVFVPLGREDILTAKMLKAEANSAQTGKEVNRFEVLSHF